MSLTRGFNEVESIIAKTLDYLSVPAVVGYEGYFLDYLNADFQKLGLTTVRRPSLLAVSGERPNETILCAHMDRHGLVSAGYGEYFYAAQYIRRLKYGDQSRSSKKELDSIARRFEGERVFAYDPRTAERLGEGEIESSAAHMAKGDCVFTVRGMDEVPPGTPLAYARTARSNGNDIYGQLDNAISLGVAHTLFRAGFEGTALFAAEEEIGKSWVHIAEYLEHAGIRTRSLLVIDTSPYAERQPIENGIITLRNRDKSAVFNGAFVQKLRARCADLNQPYEMKDEVLLAAGRSVEDLGSTELGRLIEGSRGRWSGASLQIPTTLYHTSNETTTRAALKNYVRLLIDILIEAPFDLGAGESSINPCRKLAGSAP